VLKVKVSNKAGLNPKSYPKYPRVYVHWKVGKSPNDVICHFASYNVFLFFCIAKRLVCCEQVFWKKQQKQSHPWFPVPNTVKCYRKKKSFFSLNIITLMELKLKTVETKQRSHLKVFVFSNRMKSIFEMKWILHHMTRPGSVLEGFRHTLNRHALESGLFPLS